MTNSIEQPNLQPQTVTQKIDDSKFIDFSARLEQVTTRGDGKLEKGGEFKKEEIDFKSALDHLKIHHEGDAAGSQFNSNMIETPQDVEALLKKLFPSQLNYDQYGRAEITFEVSHSKEEPLGWTGVKSVEEIKGQFPGAKIEKKVRMPGGEYAEVDGIKGAWYPEMARNPKTGQFEVLKDEEGGIKNPKGKFEPEANVATVAEEEFKDVAKTNLITVIIQKDKETLKPTVVTIFSGENAPAYPVKINSESFKLDTLKGSQASEYWEKHAFIQTEKRGRPEKKEEIKEVKGQVGFLNFKVKVKVGPDKNVTFLEDVEEYPPSMMAEDDIQDLFDARILFKGNPGSVKSRYELATDGFDGYVKLDKEELNAAIQSGKIIAEIDEDGDLRLHL